MAMTPLRLLRCYIHTLYGLMAMVCIRSCDNYITTALCPTSSAYSPTTHATHGADCGDWYFPNGSRLNFNNDSIDIYEVRIAKRVDLRRRNPGEKSGMYHCTVETNAVHNDSGWETVYVGLYASGGECTHTYI